MKKRGMSGVVTTLVIILISLVAIGVIWVVVSAIIKAGSSDVTLDGLITDLKITNAFESASSITVLITRKSGNDPISKILFLLSNGTFTENVTKSVSGLSTLISKSFTVTPLVLNSSEIVTVSIVPIFSRGGKDFVDSKIADIYTINHDSVGTDEEDPNLPPVDVCVANCPDGGSCGDSDGCGGKCDWETCGEGMNCMLGACVADPIPCVPEDKLTTCGTWICGSK